jgi:hypothetical protein
VFRRAAEQDLPGITALHEVAQTTADVAAPHSPPRRRWLLAHEGSTTWVVERAGEVVATGRTTPPDEGVLLADAASLDPAAAADLLRGVAALAPGEPVRVVERPGTDASTVLTRAPRGAGTPAAPREVAEQYYVRLPDVAVVLDRLRPVLSQRLAGSGLDRDGRDLVLSTFRRHYRAPVRDGAVGPFAAGGPMQGPGAAGGAGVAPDQLPALLFGGLGITGLTRIRPDVYPGPDPELFAALFPPLRADLLTYYLPY